MELTDDGHCLFLLRLLKEQKKTERALTEAQESAFWHVWKPPVRAYAPCAVLKCATYVCTYVRSFQRACTKKGIASTYRHSASLFPSQPNHPSVQDKLVTRSGFELHRHIKVHCVGLTVLWSLMSMLWSSTKSILSGSTECEFEGCLFPHSMLFLFV